MKRLSRVSIVCLVLAYLVLSYKQDNAPSANCPNAGAYVKHIKKGSGQVYYDSTQSSLFIRVPNSFDSYDIGYAYNLVDKFQKTGLNVRFSGSYYDYNGTPYGVAGNKYFYLSLESVSSDN